MNRFNLALVFFLAIPTVSYAGSADNVSWEQYLKSVETYSNDNSENESSHKREVTPQSNSVNSNEIRKQMGEHHEKQLFNIKKLFNEKTDEQETLSASRTKQESTVHLNEYHVIQKTRFNWNGKSSNYKYADYEITIDPTSKIHTKELMDFMSKMSLDGWEIDLNKSMQSHKGNTVTSITQIRFKKNLSSN